MAAIESVNSVVSAAGTTVINNKTTQELGKYEFFKILAAELQNQDPSNPMDNKDFIAQLAQFSTLEQMQNMSAVFSDLNVDVKSFLEQQTRASDSLLLMQSASLIGKNAVAQVDDTNIEGRVDSIIIKDSIPYAIIDAMTVPLNSITKIYSEHVEPGVIKT